MDRFKFRAWDKEEQGMSKPFTISELALSEALPKYAIDNYILMQCTGLKDKHGKLIFEGDILKGEDPNGEGLHPFEVCWSSDSGGYMYEYPFSEYDLTTIHYGAEQGFKFEIIGNIYENPDFLQNV